MQKRLKLVHVDDRARKYEVELARRWLYEEGVAIDSTAMKNLLGPKSLTPTRVCYFTVTISFPLMFITPECIFAAPWTIWF